MRISRGQALGWVAHFAVSLGLLTVATAPGWREMVVPDSLSAIEWLIVISARVLTTPLLPLAEWAGLPVWKGALLPLGLALNSGIWVAAAAWIARRVGPPRT